MMTEQRIDHVAKASHCANKAWGANNPIWAAVWMQKANMHATLALVEQQRIANLIALGSLTSWESQLPGHPIEHAAFAEIGDPDSGEFHPDIREALGIKNDE